MVDAVARWASLCHGLASGGAAAAVGERERVVV